MDSFSDPALKLKYNKSKIKVKIWESEFRKKTGNNPSKDDIKDAPCEIREAYKWYWRLKMESLKQDSVLDATFIDLRQIEPLPAAFTPEDSHSTDLVSVFPKEDQCVKTSDSSSSVDPCVTGPVAENSFPSTQHEENSSQTETALTEPSDALSTSVWGSHLNQPVAKDVDRKKKNLGRSSSSFQLSEKLFVGAKLKKRNPRKSMSFSAGRIREKSLVSSDSLLIPSDSSFSIDSSQGLDDGFPVGDLESSIAAQNDSHIPSCDFKLIKKNITLSAQPVSAVQKMIDGNAKPLKPKVERSVDKGWLERVMQTDEILTQQATDSFNPYNAEQFKCEVKGIPPSSEDSDDDIIYGSDTESKSPRKIEKEEKVRLALRSTTFKEPAPSVPLQDTENNLNSSVIVKSEIGVKKRKLDAIEAAMAVLSERRKNDKSFSQPNKKRKKSDSSQGETLKNKSELSNELQKDVSSILGDENMKSTDFMDPKRNSKAVLSKKEVLEKKVASGTVNENFVRINMKKKVFVRGKKTMNFQKYKKQQWKNKKKELSDQASAYISRMDPGDSAAGGGLQKCFKCGDVGHFARQCPKMKGDSLMPREDDDEEESPFPSLAEVEMMAKERCDLIRSTVKRTQKQEEDSDNKKSSSGASTCSASGEQETEAAHSTVENPPFEHRDDIDSSVMKEPEREAVKNFGSVEPLYSLTSDGSLMHPPCEVYDALHKFGHEKFRPGQEEAIMRILSGLSTLVTLSTGSGKSLCYQLPAYLYASKRDCITLIVSPLVSLMDDQISGLPSFIKGAALHTAQTEKQREKVIEMAKAGKLHFLLVSPEAVVAGEKKSGFGSVLRSLPNIAFACIDEAHCVSQWSHNFRPSYLVIFKVLREKFGVQTILGLTATATQTAVASIIEYMQIPDGRKGVIQDTPLPNNLLLTVSKDSSRDQALMKLLGSNKFEDYKSVIVYCTRREECERLAALLRTCLKKTSEVSIGKQKVSTVAEAYHAGLSATRRKQVQNAFMSGTLRIVVATVAFGMGINKADIRSVIHFNMPSNFESYVQEVGRAGRDGQLSHCHLFLSSEGKDLNELRRHIFANSLDRHTIRKLLQRVFVPCKCGKKSDDVTEVSTLPEKAIAMKGLKENEKESQEKSQNCVGHEVSFSVEETVAALDLPEENITTLLSYLELHDKNLISVLPKAYTMCKIQSYKGMRHIREVARSCPPLAMAIALDMMSGKSSKVDHQIEFPVVQIASAIGWDSGIVKRELMNLEWTKVNGSSRRSGIKVELFDLGFRIKAPGNLAPEKLDATLDFLHNRAMKQEHIALSQLQAIFSAVMSVSHPTVSKMMEFDESDLQTHSENLKTVVRAYFQADTLTSENFKPEVKLENGEQIASDTRQLVNLYRDCSFTGRSVARIFHGISSPNFPALVWGRCRFWRAHLESDFKLICLLATQVLLKMR